MEEYEGYVIITRAEHSCIGFNPKALPQYVCWMYKYDGSGVHRGIYSNDLEYLLDKFRDRESAYL